MNDSNLATYGVVEMSETQLNETDGGYWGALGIIGIVALCYYFGDWDR